MSSDPTPKRPTFEAIASQQIAALRLASGWSQSELARRMTEAGWPKYTQMTVSRTEKGERPIRLDELASYAEVFGRPLAELWLSADEQAWQYSTAEREKAEDTLLSALAQYSSAMQHLALVADTLAAEGELSPSRQKRIQELLDFATPHELFHITRVEKLEDRRGTDERFRTLGGGPDGNTTRRLEGEYYARWAEIYVATPEEATELRLEEADARLEDEKDEDDA